MSRSDRLFNILQILQDGALHTAGALAERLGVSQRTLYRDMDKLAASGVPVQGTRGTGYRLADLTALPPLMLTSPELEALNLGLAIAAQVADPDLKAAATRVAEKIDAALPEVGAPPHHSWGFATSPFTDAARSFAHMPTLRAAIKARQKLRITYTGRDGDVSIRVIRPLEMSYWTRIWAVTAWCEQAQAHRVFRLDLITSAEALPELFTEEPGKTLADYTPNP